MSSSINAVEQMENLNTKIKEYIPDRVVHKPLTRWNEAYKEFPRYVMEYLVAKYVEQDNPLPGQKKIDRLLTEHYIESEKKELIKSKIKENQEYILLGNLRVRLDAAKDHYWADVPALGERYVRIAPLLLKDYGEALLTAGAWGTMKIVYDPTYEIKNRKYPFLVIKFTPFQITRINLEDYLEKRKLFDTWEWIDLLIQTIGYNPYSEELDNRVKALMMLRLVSFVEPNFNMIELGPAETGKTYIARNTSSRAFVISGGKTTVPYLFYHKSRNQIGIVGQKDIVFFDEIGNTRFDDPEATVSMLQDYMQSGKFSRGNLEFSSQASIVLGGNIDTDLENKRVPEGRYKHLFEPLPEELQKRAFLDRIHCFIPGWEMPKIKPENYAKGYGLITDYFAEIMKELRRKNYQILVSANVKFDSSQCTERSQTAVKKTVAGLLKLIFPHRNSQTIEREELKFCMDLAVECRQRVLDQLKEIARTEYEGQKVAWDFK